MGVRGASPSIQGERSPGEGDRPVAPTGGEWPYPAGWIPAAESRNDSDGRGLEGRGPPPLDPSMLQRRTFSMLRVSGPSAPGKATGRSPLRDGEGIEPPPLRPRFLAEPRNDSEKGVGV